ANPPSRHLDVSLAFTICALLLWIPASFSPLLTVAAEGTVHRSGLATGVAALWSGGFPSLAVVVAAFSLAAPWLYLLLMTLVLIGVHLDAARTRAAPALAVLFRWGLALRPWTMIEVYLLGACVAYSRIEQVAFVRVAAAGWCLLAAAILLLLADAVLDERAVWDALPIRPARMAQDGPSAALACHICELVVPGERDGDACPRCRAPLHARKRASLQRTTALVACGFLLFIPANLLPVLTIERFGRMQSSTILGGVFELAGNGLWPLAVIVFTASIAIPLAKLWGLSWNLILTRRRSARLLIARTRLHRAIDLIGRWSNIDVFMVSILLALVQFGALTRVRVEPGMIAFAAVVIVTMIAAKSFDSRLMWDAAGERA
ncbi:MAG: paraquat-inducible protein A, partial [Steroidobacteraceae bacterium]